MTSLRWIIRWNTGLSTIPCHAMNPYQMKCLPNTDLNQSDQENESQFTFFLIQTNERNSTEWSLETDKRDHFPFQVLVLTGLGYQDSFLFLPWVWLQDFKPVLVLVFNPVLLKLKEREGLKSLSLWLTVSKLMQLVCFKLLVWQHHHQVLIHSILSELSFFTVLMSWSKSQE